MHVETGAPLAKEALERIAELFAIEAGINGRSPTERVAVRQVESVPRIPVSTTHTITNGVGAARKVSAVRWNVASNVVFAWIVTLPATAVFGAAFYALGTVLF